MKPIVALTFDYYPETYTFAYPLLYERGLVGTYFVAPSSVGQTGGPTRAQLMELKVAGWTIGAYTDANMVTMYDANPISALDHLFGMKQTMNAFGLPTRSLAPQSRVWSVPLRNITAGLFDRVRAVSGKRPQQYPLPDPLYIDDGGTNSLSNADTPEKLHADFNAFMQSGGGLWSIVCHRVVIDPGIDYSITADKLKPLLDRLVQERALGRIDVLGYDDLKAV